MNSDRDPADIVNSPRQEPRLPPGQIVTEKWPVSHHGTVPGIDLARWDLVLEKQTSDEPYFIHYDKFIEAGIYSAKLTLEGENMEHPFTVVQGGSPYLVK